MSAEEILRGLSTFVSPGGVFEIRVFGSRGAPNGGFFDDLQKAAEVAHRLDQSRSNDGVYFTINPVNPDLLARYCNKMCQGRNANLTKEQDVLKREWMLVDIDIRDKLQGISSRDSEHDEALAEAAKLKDRLTKDWNWPQPVMADSGNGAHLLYKIDLPNSEEAKNLVKGALEALEYISKHPRLKIDSAPHDAGRITKVYGTWNRKGDEVGDRRHRQSKLLSVPEKIDTLSEKQLKDLVSLHEMAVGSKEPEPQSQPARAGIGIIEDMPKWLTEHNLPWKNTKPAKNGGTSYILKECPGCHNTDNNCHVSKYPDGGQHAACKHDSCPIKDWPSFRKIVEPEFYQELERRRQSRQERDQNRRKRTELPDLSLDELCKVIIQGSGDKKVEVHVFSPDKAADSICQRFDIVTTEDDKIWVYRDGYYSTAWWIEIADLVNNVCGDLYLTKSRKELEAKVHSKTRVKEEIFYKNPYLLCCKNCTIDLTTGEVLEHSPEHYLNSPSAFVYDPTAWPEAFIQLLDESCFNDVDRMTLIDWLVATCCMVSFEYILFLTGGGSNGKKMYEDVLAAMFPTATEHVGLAELIKERFVIGQLKLARTNVFNETNVDRAATERVKSLSAGDMQSSDVKNQRLRVIFRPFLQLIFDTNSMPRFNDSSYGFRRRFTRVKMPFTFKDNPSSDPKKFEKKADPTLGERLVSEKNMSGVLNLIIARAPDIVKSRRITRRENDYEEYERDAHSFNLFVEDFIDFNVACRDDVDYRIAADELYGHFKEYIKFGGSPMSKFSFSRKIGELNKMPSVSIRVGTSFVRGFKGLKFKLDKFQERQELEAKRILCDDCDDLVTSYTGENTDTGEGVCNEVTSVTSYKEIKHRVKDKALYREEFRPGHHATRHILPTDSEKDIESREPKNDIKRQKVTSIRDESEGKTEKDPFRWLRITKTCEFQGKTYNEGEKVRVPLSVAKNLCGTIEERFDTCTACGKHIKIDPAQARGGLCKECFRGQEAEDLDSSACGSQHALQDLR